MDPYLRNVFTGGESTDDRPATCVSPILKALTQDPAKGFFTPAAHHASLTASPSLDRSTLELTRSLTSVLSTSGSSPTPAVLPLITRAVTSLEHMYGIFTQELRRLALLSTSAGSGECPPLTLPYSLATEALQCGDGLMAVLCERGGEEELACVARCLVGYLSLASTLVDTVKERQGKDRASLYLSQLLPFIYAGMSRCLALDSALLARPMPIVPGLTL